MYISLLPAIDVSDGRAVRLLKGELEQSTQYGSPQSIAQEFVEVFKLFAKTCADTKNSQYPFWVHLVDLDAAFGRGDNQKVIKATVSLLVENGINVELSGGIRSDESLEYALSIGATRVNIGTAALEDQKWTNRVVLKYADKIAIGLDVRGETLASRGWVKEIGNIWDIAKKLADDGVKRFVVTDVNKDGTMQGMNFDLLIKVADQFKIPITASGGVASLDDIKKVKTISKRTDFLLDSVIFGKALYNGNFTLYDALVTAIS